MVRRRHPFRHPGQQHPARNGTFVGAGLTAEITDSIDITPSCDAEANPNYLVHTINGSVSLGALTKASLSTDEWK